MFTGGIRRLGHLGTVVSSGVVSGAVFADVLNEAQIQPRVARPAMTAAALFDFDSDESYHIIDNKSGRGLDSMEILSQAKESEISAALETIQENPDLLTEFLPRDLVHRHPEQAQRIVQNIVNRPDFITNVGTILHKMESKNKAVAAKKEVRVESAGTTDACANQLWEKIRDEYKCALCLDVLAAPTLLECSHNFCGVCAEELVSRCVPCSPVYDGDCVVVSCPTCRTEIHSNPVFERMLDQKIEEAARTVPDNFAPKMAWAERRAEYTKILRQRAIEKKAAPSAAPAHFAREFGIDLNSDSYELNDFLNNDPFWYAAITFAVSVLLGVMFYNRR
jgi:hypothetical protein